MMRRFATGLVIVALLLPPAAHATTAASLSGRIHIDGDLSEYAPDEWVLDATSPFPEPDNDSAWGHDNDIVRMAVTWDASFLYVAIEARSFDTFLAAFISNRAGGLTTLEDTGAFRRAMELPGSPINLMALASPDRIPEVARADDSHPFSLVNRADVPAAISGSRSGPVGFEMAVPWSMLSLSSPLRIVGAVTGDVGTGAGDSAPDASSAQRTDRFVRAVLDRCFEISADANHDGIPDAGVAPRTAGRVQPSTTTSARDGADARFVVGKRAFAPDRGESPAVDFEVNGAGVYVNFFVYSLDGQRVKWLNRNDPDLQIAGGSVPVAWDGTNESGAIVRGGTYIVVADWGYNRGEHAGRTRTAVVVAR